MLTATNSPTSTCLLTHTMGAIDPLVARKHAKIKSEAIEVRAKSGMSPMSQPFEDVGPSSPAPSPVAILTMNGTDHFDYSHSLNNSSSSHKSNYSTNMDSKLTNSNEQFDNNASYQAAADHQQQTSPKLRNNSSSFHVKAKKFLTLSPGSGLKPSASTSCLNLADADEETDTITSITPTSQQETSNISNATRASMTHEWKKLKTPNKCRECNLLVYFNGRECSFCGFVAHKKCVAVIVIKCRGQQVSGNSPINNNSKYRNGTRGQQQRQSRSSQSIESIIGQHQQPPQLQQYQQLLQSPRKNKSFSVQPIFGQPVNTDDRQVIDFVRRFIYEIDLRGLTLKGIYRVSSIKSKVDKLCNYYDQNLSSLVDLSSFHPNIIANALKMYLRQLPEPLLTNELYNKFIEVAKKYSDKSASPALSPHNKPIHLKPQSSLSSTAASVLMQRQRKPYPFPFTTTTVATTATSNIDPAYDPLLIVELKEIIELLPSINRELIAILMRHLRRVADMSCENQMSAKNLSIIFGPTLLSADNKSLAIVDNIHQARVVELMITWADQIFPQYTNYESRAVIELDLSALLDEQETTNYSQMQQRKSGDKNKYKLSDDGQLIIDSKARQSRSSMSGNIITKDSHESNTYEINLHQPPKTRSDLRELRRQFFTVPTTTNITQQQVTTNSNNPKEEQKKYDQLIHPEVFL